MVVKIAIQHIKSYDLRHTVRCRTQPESESGEIEAESLPEACSFPVLRLRLGGCCFSPECSLSLFDWYSRSQAAVTLL
ncbi:phosphodiester glycosidase family protein, partial [Sesbania bispinosa]